MTTLQLDRKEQEVLMQVLDRCLMNIDHEISHTYHGEFKQVLRQKRALIEGILGKLPKLADQPA